MEEFMFRENLSAMARERLGESEIAEMITLVLENGAISFGAGEPSHDLFPKEGIREAFVDAFDDPDIWGYYHDSYGDTGLRAWIAERMGLDSMAPAWVAPEHVLLTNGGGEAVSLVSEALIDAGSVVLVESPTYTETLLTFRKQGAVCALVPSDDDGLIPEEMERILARLRARFLYTIPNFQNPSGRTSPVERRKKILEIARRHDLAIVEDDPYHYLSYDGAAPESYLRLAGDDKRVIHCNSFSKTLAPGLRVGWAIVPPALASVFEPLRVSAGLGRPALVQKAVHAYLGGIDFSMRIAGLCSEYKRRRDVMLEMIARHLSPLGIRTNVPKGGFFIWAQVPADTREDFDSGAFAKHAVTAEKIGVIPGNAFYPEKTREGARAFRLSYAKIKTDDMEEGVARLARAWNAFA
ncbi:PLP-dependent aminotransferase family protein [Synergistaceae bacterium OttesenSCG-928-I11]|nr:PLP-dependent aminotransferase family protein [Synergistaceae bacterium OttesenSCG-928-I11]